MKEKSIFCETHQHYDRAVDELRDAGLKMTEPRKAVLVFLTSSHGPFTIEQIHEGVKKRSCNLTTIYRILFQFEKLGLVWRIDRSEGPALYEYRCRNNPHHHLICKNCHKITAVGSDEMFVFPSTKQLKSKGFSMIYPSLELLGLCIKCAR